MGKRKRLHRYAVAAGLEQPYRIETPSTEYFRCPKCNQGMTTYQVPEHRCFQESAMCHCGQKAGVFLSRPEKNDGVALCEVCAAKVASGELKLVEITK